MIDENGKASAPRSKDTLALRIASAMLLAPLAVGASWAGGSAFAGLVAFLSVLMAYEWARMIERDELTPVFYALAIGAAAAMVLAAAERYAGAYAVCAVSALAAGAGSMRGARRPLWAGLGAFYFIAPSIALIWLREDVADGRGLVLLLFAIVWSADTGGYIGGRLIGGPRISPAISPAKTWAGAIGGLMAGAFATAIGAPVFFGEPARAVHLIVGAVLGVASISGDMAESGIKRRFAIKDMSGFIPGHGGVLDRLDGMIFVTTAVTLVVYGHRLIAGL
ncbi:MAG: phosphatidate cytidylyltransferase [Parvularculaceae bacterium]|nr:phosphatidate cytidylyltransferase [Parvularculaceae bacterium]